eukprot:5016691-Amphidinium_carterae.2
MFPTTCSLTVEGEGKNFGKSCGLLSVFDLNQLTCEHCEAAISSQPTNHWADGACTANLAIVYGICLKRMGTKPEYQPAKPSVLQQGFKSDRSPLKRSFGHLTT